MDKEQAFDPRFSGTDEVRDQHRFDVARLEAWLTGRLEGFRGPLRVSEFKGGQSNPTYLLEGPTGEWVLRRKPPGKLLKSAHAVDREYRAMAALNRIDFPVPRAHLLCEDPDVIGTTFYVMERVEGRVLWNPLLPASLARSGAGSTSRWSTCSLACTWRTHEALGLAEFGRPGNYFRAPDFALVKAVRRFGDRNDSRDGQAHGVAADRTFRSTIRPASCTATTSWRT